MQIGVFKVIYLPNQTNVLNRKIVKELISSHAFSVQKIKTTEGLNAIQEIPSVLWLLELSSEHAGCVSI